MSLFDFVEQHHAVGTAAHCFGELAAFVISDVPGGRAYESTDRVLLHVFGHVDAHHGTFVVEQELCECTSKLCLADAGWPEEHERTNRTIRVGQACPTAANGVGDGGDSIVLADHALMQKIFEVHQLVHLTFHQATDRNASPLRHDFGNVFGIDFLFQHPFAGLQLVEMCRRIGDALFELGNSTVTNFGSLLQILLAFNGCSQRLELFLETADGGNCFALSVPMAFHLFHLRLQTAQLIVEVFEPLFRGSIGFLL